MKAIISIVLVFVISNCALITSKRDQPNRKSRHFSKSSDMDYLLDQDEPQLSDRALARINSSDNRGNRYFDRALSIGLPKKYVRMRLGSPRSVEVAGNPKYENERWTYEQAVHSNAGHFYETKVVYFENGEVVGWESR